jgi:cysteine desulfuration protein SufE
MNPQPVPGVAEMDFAELEANLLLFEDWADRYQYIIGLGAKLPPLDEKYRTDTYKVDGCMSQVWLHSQIIEDDSDRQLRFDADSDSTIVKGLFAILRILYSDKTAEQILAVDLESTFRQIGLEQHLSPNRRNGFFSMIEEIRRAAIVVRSTS